MPSVGECVTYVQFISILMELFWFSERTSGQVWVMQLVDLEKSIFLYTGHF